MEYWKLSRGERQYLKGHEITEKDWKKMDTTSKQEWKEECQETHYRNSYDRNEAVGRKVFGGFK